MYKIIKFLSLATAIALSGVEVSQANGYPLLEADDTTSAAIYNFKFNRSEANRRILYCYAEAMDWSYIRDTNITELCSSDDAQDHRNGMREWKFDAQPGINSKLYQRLSYWDRSKTVGSSTRRELLIVLRGTEGAVDLTTDAFSQGPTKTINVQTLLGTFSNDDWEYVSGRPLMLNGFRSRYIDTVNAISRRIKELERWQQEDPHNYHVGIKIVGHSLGAVEAEMVGHMIARRFSKISNGSANFDVEVLAFNPPLVGNKTFAEGIYKASTRCRYNVIEISNTDDIIYSLPTGNFTTVYHVKDKDFEPVDPNHHVCKYGGSIKDSFSNRGMPEAENNIAQLAARHSYYQYMINLPTNAQGETATTPGNIIAAQSMDHMVNLFPEKPIGSLNFTTEGDDFYDYGARRNLMAVGEWKRCASLPKNPEKKSTCTIRGFPENDYVRMGNKGDENSLHYDDTYVYARATSAKIDCSIAVFPSLDKDHKGKNKCYYLDRIDDLGDGDGEGFPPTLLPPSSFPPITITPPGGFQCRKCAPEGGIGGDDAG